MRRVAHDDDLVAAQFFSQHVAAAFVCDGGNLIAIFTVVGERTGLKGVPKAEAAQFDFRAEPDVAGELGRLGVAVRIPEAQTPTPPPPSDIKKQPTKPASQPNK